MSDERRPLRGLGRGLSALLGDDLQPAPVAAPMTNAVTPLAGSRSVAIEHLHRGRFQPRRQFDPEQIEALAESIRAQGVLQPLLVRPHPQHPGEFEILAGERRWRAAQAAQLVEVPVLVRDIDNRAALEVALVENVQRQDLNAIEEARGYQRLVDEFGHTQEDIARVTGKSRPHIANTLRLLNLPDEVLALVEEGKLSPGHVRPLIGHEDAVAIAREAEQRGLTARQIEARAKPKPPAPEKPRVPEPGLNPNANLRALERELETLTGMKTMIAADDGLGTVTFIYSDLDQIDELLGKLRGKVFQ
ncbi:MAG TPA: ParB/RepB/Spo0J family partition protein [Stellaceae bacterium]|jgi:ParB family chromosome partitioning protein|nr:ParB/RepB/Spo0J family partition protein [Stellaceae bacterium]